MVELPGSVSIDLTPDVIAAMGQVQTQREGFEPWKESIQTGGRRRGCPDPR